MRFFFIWFILSLMVGVFANGKGRSAAGFFLLSMLTSPLIGFAVVFALAPHPRRIQEGLRKGTLRKCPSCGFVAPSGKPLCPKCLQPRPDIIDVTPLEEDPPR